MIILGIETSCDETSAAIVKNGTKILGNSVATSLDIQQKYGGVVPEIAARKQTEFMIPVLEEAFRQARINKQDIDAIAVTYGPGLMGPLLVGLETAKTLSYIWQKPLVPINHLIGHIHSAWLDGSQDPPQFPLLVLIASGGHTDLLILQSHKEINIIGSTRDDAVGEAFDKVARILGFNYPGGPEIEKAAVTGNPSIFPFPRPMLNSNDFDFSYSGLKTSVLYVLKKINRPNAQTIADLAASFQQAALEVLVEKTLKAVRTYPVKSVLITGGVAANQLLKHLMQSAITLNHPGITLHIPPLGLATDNATYIAGAAYFLYDQLALDPIKDKNEMLLLEPAPNLTAEELYIKDAHENHHPRI